MLTAIRARFTAVRHDAGVTLIELVVAMVLATILGAGAMTWFIGASDASTSTTDSDAGTAGARNVLQTWAAVLRVAGSPTAPGTGTGRITSLSATSITFNAYQVGTGSTACTSACTAFATRSVTLAMTGAGCGQTRPTTCQLVESGAGSGPSTGTTVILPGGVSAGACLFTAYDATGANLGCTGLTTDQLASVTRVALAFAVTADGHTRNFQTSASFTQRPNTTVGTGS